MASGVKFTPWLPPSGGRPSLHTTHNSPIREVSMDSDPRDTDDPPDRDGYSRELSRGSRGGLSNPRERVPLDAVETSSRATSSCRGATSARAGSRCSSQSSRICVGISSVSAARQPRRARPPNGLVSRNVDVPSALTGIRCCTDDGDRTASACWRRLRLLSWGSHGIGCWENRTARVGARVQPSGAAGGCGVTSEQDAHVTPTREQTRDARPQAEVRGLVAAPRGLLLQRDVLARSSELANDRSTPE